MPYATAEARSAYQRLYRVRTADRRSARRRMDDIVRHANRRAEQFGAPGKITIQDVRDLLSPGAVCAYCGTEDDLGLDHIRPLARGGANCLDNLQVSCRTCNKRKWIKPSPQSWSIHGPQCVGCGTQDRKHVARGLCNACYRRGRKSNSRGRTVPNTLKGTRA